MDALSAASNASSVIGELANSDVRSILVTVNRTPSRQEMIVQLIASVITIVGFIAFFGLIAYFDSRRDRRAAA